MLTGVSSDYSTGHISPNCEMPEVRSTLTTVNLQLPLHAICNIDISASTASLDIRYDRLSEPCLFKHVSRGETLGF